MTFNPSTTALLVTDPQNDFLSPDGATWELIGTNVTKNRTVEHLEQLISGYGIRLQGLGFPSHYWPLNTQSLAMDTRQRW